MQMLRKLINFFVISLLCASCATEHGLIGGDGLPETPDKTESFDISQDDETVYGISRKETFFIDINNDGKKDKIIRGKFDTMTAHGYTFYEIYLADNIQIGKFRTIEGADCFLTAYKFQFYPFVLTKASRSLGKDNWIQSTSAKTETYKIMNDKLEKFSEKSMGKLCDVRELL